MNPGCEKPGNTRHSRTPIDSDQHDPFPFPIDSPAIPVNPAFFSASMGLGRCAAGRLVQCECSGAGNHYPDGSAAQRWDYSCVGTVLLGNIQLHGAVAVDPAGAVAE